MNMAASRISSPGASRAHSGSERKKGGGRNRGKASPPDEAATDIDDRRIQRGSYSDRASSGRKVPGSRNER